MNGSPSSAITFTRCEPGVQLETAAPSSKSLTNRALLIAALAEGRSTLRHPLVSDDVVAMRDAIRSVGVEIETEGEGWYITGGLSRLHSPASPLHAALSGTTMRFLTAFAPLLPRGAEIVGAPPLLRRPIGPLVEALRRLGAQSTDTGGFPPTRSLGGAIRGGSVVVDARLSSQFASALLLVAPYAANDTTVTVTNAHGLEYVELTADMMRQCGAELERVGDNAWAIRAGALYGATALDIEYDASAAAHLFALALATAGEVTVTNTQPTLQPDAEMVDVFERMGASIVRDGRRTTVRGPEEILPVSVDLGHMPDQLPTVASLASLANGTTSITNVAITRGHETDRIHALATELGKTGVEAHASADSLTITSNGRPHPAVLHCYDDHRLAMAFAALAARVPGTTIIDPACVAKTFPTFWQQCARAGLRWRDRQAQETPGSGAPALTAPIARGPAITSA